MNPLILIPLLAALTPVQGKVFWTQKDIREHWLNCPIISEQLTRQTNVISGDNHSGCPYIPKGILDANGILSIPAVYHPHHPGCTPFVPATEKWIITNIVDVYTLHLHWHNEPRTIQYISLLSSTTNRWKLLADWKEVK